MGKEYRDLYIEKEINKKGLNSRHSIIRELNAIARDLPEHKRRIEVLLNRADKLYEQLGEPNILRQDYYLN